MTDLNTYETDDASFVDDLKQSDKHVDKIVLWLESQGVEATKKPIRIRDKVENMSDFSDDGDIDVVWNGVEERIEVKQRRIHFTCANDFPYKTIIVDVAHTWDRADPKPLAYVLTNKETTYCAIVKRSTSDKWIRITKRDRFKNRDRTFLECPIEYLDFRKIELPEKQ